MKRRLTAVLLACALSPVALAQKEPSEVSDKEIAGYKVTAESECRAGAVGKGDPADIAAFCSCLFKSLDKTMTRPEWQQVYFYAHHADKAKAREVLDPHLKKAECRPQGAAKAQPAQPLESPNKPLDLKLRVR
jgi:hypothetical protein